MEFEFSVSLQEAREAFWLHYWNLRTKLAVIVFLVIALADSFLLFATVASDVSTGEALRRSLGSDSVNTLMILLGVFLLFFSYVFVFLPWWALRLFRKNPWLLNCRKASITHEYFEVQAEGGTSKLNWPTYKYWREGKNVIILKVLSGQYQAISKSGLSEDQLQELRSILTSALAQQK